MLSQHINGGGVGMCDTGQGDLQVIGRGERREQHNTGRGTW